MSERIIALLLSKRNQSHALMALLWLIVLVTVWLLHSVLLPVFLAIFLAYVLNPLVQRMRRIQVKGRHLPPALATVTLYLLFFALVALLGRVTFPVVAQELVRLGKLSSSAVAQMQKDAPQWLERSAQMLKDYDIPLRLVWGAPAPAESETQTQVFANEDGQMLSPDGDTIRPDSLPVPLRKERIHEIDLQKELGQGLGQIAASLSHGAGRLMTELKAWTQNLFSLIFKTFLVLMMSAFLLSDIENIKRFFFKLVPISDQENFDRLLARIDRGLSGVVRGQLIICTANGLLTLIGMLILGVPLAFLLAGLATVLSLIPIFGSIISTIPIVAVALTQSFSMALLSVFWVIGVHLLEANLLNPKIMGDSAKIHPVLVIVALLAGEHYYGLVGALFAVPIASILLTLFNFIHQKALAWQGEADGAQKLKHAQEQGQNPASTSQSPGDSNNL